MVLLLNVLNGIIRLAYWLLFTPVYIFASPILLARGYSTTMTGMIIAGSSILAIFVQSVLAGYADRNQKISTMRLSLYTLLVCLPLYTALLFLLKASFIHTVIFVAVLSSVTALRPFVNNFTFKLAETGYKMYFDVSLFVGAIGFSAVSKLAGYVNSNYGTTATIWMAVAGLIIFAVTLYIGDRVIRKYRKEESVKQVKETENVPYPVFIKHNIIFVLAAVGLAFSGFFDNFFSSFNILIVQRVGGNSADVGNIMSFASLCQLPAYFFIPFLKKKVKYSHLLIFASLMYFVKAVMIVTSSSLMGIYLTGLTRMLNYSLLSSAIVPFVNNIMPGNEANRGQTLYHIMSAVASIIASSLGGILIDNMGVQSSMYVAMFISLAGLLVVIPTMYLAGKKYETKRIVE